MRERAHPSCVATESELAGVRALFVHDGALQEEDAHGTTTESRAATLADGFREKGAYARVVASPARPRALRDIVDQALPAVIFVCGPAACGAAVDAAPWLPLLRVMGPGDDVARWPAARSGAREVALWAGQASDAPVVEGLPLVAIGSLEAPSAAAAVEECARMILALAEALRCRSPMPPQPLRMERADFLAYLRGIVPPVLRGEGRVEALVDASQLLGMPAWPDPSDRARVTYDRFRSWQWLFANAPTFFEADKRAHRTAREAAACAWVPEARSTTRAEERSTLRRERALVRPTRVRVRVGVEVVPEGLQDGVRVFLPAPIEGDAQVDVALVEASDDRIRVAYAGELGFVYGADLPLSPQGIHAWATFELTRYEIEARGFARPDARVPEGADAAVAVTFARSLDDAYARAFVLHEWMMRVGSYEKRFEPCPCGPCAARAFDEHRAGHCITLAHAFVHYCERASLRARPVRGAMFTYVRDRERGTYGCSVRGEPVIGHTWAEVEVPGVGFLPVEFDPLVIRAATEANCPDEALRRSLARDYAFYRDAYFGGLDAQHLTFSRSVLSIPAVLVRNRVAPRGEELGPIDARHVTFSMEASYP